MVVRKGFQAKERSHGSEYEIKKESMVWVTQM